MPTVIISWPGTTAEKEGGRSFLEGKDEGIEGAGQHALPDERQRNVLEGPHLGGSDAFGGLRMNIADLLFWMGRGYVKVP